MTTDVRKAEIHEIQERYQVRYEVCPYYVVWEQHPESGPPVNQRVQAGFDVDLYATLDKYQLPLFHTDEARSAVTYFESLAQSVQSEAGQCCTVEVIPQSSIIRDTQKHFRPE